MRPPDLPGGNDRLRAVADPECRRASMRPPDLPGGNSDTEAVDYDSVTRLQ